MILSAPTPIHAEHDTSNFECGQISLDDWLKRRALANHESGASRTYVVTERNRIIAYYALCSGALACAEATGKLRRNMPDPIPMAILGRLAIDQQFQGAGLGHALFRDAVFRILSAADAIGIRGLIVHALSEDAANFYRKLGLDPSPLTPNTLMVTLAELREAL